MYAEACKQISACEKKHKEITACGLLAQSIQLGNISAYPKYKRNRVSYQGFTSL